MEAIDLRQRDLAFIQRVGDTPALLEQPVAIAVDIQDAFLEV